MVSSAAINGFRRTASRMMGDLPKLRKNLGTLVGDYGHNLLQDHASLKANALIFSTLILVLSRIGVAYGSTQKAKGTSDEQYRRQEFIRTVIRELGGWTLSFVAFRFFEKLIKNGIRYTLKLGQNQTPRMKEFFGKFGQEFQGWFKGNMAVRQPNRGPFIGREQEFSQYNKEIFNNRFVKWLIELFSKDKKLPPEAKIAHFYDWFPILIGSIPSLLLSGYTLERFSIDRSQMVVSTFNNWLNKHKQKNLPFAQTTTSPFTMPANNQQLDFANYFNSVRQKQTGRSWV